MSPAKNLAHPAVCSSTGSAKIAEVLSLVIADEVDPALRCPICRRNFARCSIAISRKGAECIFCRQTIPIWNLPLPPGISAWERLQDWRIRISPRSWRSAALTFAGCVAPLLVLVEFGAWLRSRGQDDPFSELQAMLSGALTAAAIGGLAVAIHWLWGRHYLIGHGSDASVFRGIGPIGKGQGFDLSNLSAVHLMPALTDDGQQRNVIRIEGIDFHMDFGTSLTPSQRTWVAIFLLKKAIAVMEQNATCAQ
jgi:hypothetical protein